MDLQLLSTNVSPNAPAEASEAARGLPETAPENPFARHLAEKLAAEHRLEQRLDAKAAAFAVRRQAERQWRNAQALKDSEQEETHDQAEDKEDQNAADPVAGALVGQMLPPQSQQTVQYTFMGNGLTTKPGDVRVPLSAQKGVSPAGRWAAQQLGLGVGSSGVAGGGLGALFLAKLQQLVAGNGQVDAQGSSLLHKLALDAGLSESQWQSLAAKMTDLAASKPAKSLFGVQGASSATASQQPVVTVDRTTVAGLLGDLMRQIQKMVAEAKPGPGIWVIQQPDESQLLTLAADAGMSEAEWSVFQEQYAKQGGKVDLSSLCAMLERHFDGLTSMTPATAPETDLPLLENILTRFGLDSDKVRQISNAAVSGDGSFDLAAFLAGVKGVSSSAPQVNLTPWEKEQLGLILDKAATSVGLPSQPVQPGNTLEDQFSLAQLTDYLQQGLDEIEARRVFPAAGAVINDLESLASQASFETKSVGWAPLVQDTLNKVRESLLQAAGPGNDPHVGIKAREGDKGYGLLNAQAEKNGAVIAKNLANEAKEFVLPGSTGAPGNVDAEVLAANTPGKDAGFWGQNSAMPAEGAGMTSSTGLTAADSRGAGETFAARQAPWPAFTNAEANQIYQQLSRGVMRGLENREHRLVLKLSPPELGEVRIELMVKDDHVRAMFAMESSKVKEVLENSMGQFRETLSQQGLILDECSVFVGQRDSSPDDFRRFVADWRQKRGGGRDQAPEVIPDIPFVTRDPLDREPTIINVMV